MAIARFEDHGGLRDAFVEVFGHPNPPQFGGEAKPHIGWSDGSCGVQWNTGINLRDGGATLGVNLEGLQYGRRRWPLARFIQRELESPQLFQALTHVPRPEDVTLHVWRDAWRGRHRYDQHSDHDIVDGLPLTSLALDDWKHFLNEAAECYAPPEGGRGSRKVEIRGVPVVVETMPHIQFLRVIPWPAHRSECVRAMELARLQLSPLWEFVAEQSV